jgi:Fe-S oxidoreductase
MNDEKKLNAWRSMATVLAFGRTTVEQIETIRKYGNHGVSPVLRAAVLTAHGIPKPREKAENCVIFGCYRPFTTPFFVRDCLRLLDLLNIDYTYLDREYCCGSPLAAAASKDELNDVLGTGREFNQMNRDLARQKGATGLAYCCAACVHAAKTALSDDSDHQVYIIDLILDKLENHQFRIPHTVLGYFEGCHTAARRNYPQARLNWDRYRRRLDEIEGAEIVDIPSKVCCKMSAGEIVDTALRMNLAKIVCPCSGCYSSLIAPAQGKIQLVTIPELLLQSYLGVWGRS